MKATPPIGVIAPKIPMSSKTRADKLPEKITIPTVQSAPTARGVVGSRPGWGGRGGVGQGEEKRNATTEPS